MKIYALPARAMGKNNEEKVSLVKKMKKLLVANRGEIALRIIRTAKEVGLDTVAVYEKPDREAYYLRFADEAIMIGDGPRKDYLNIDKIIWAAQNREQTPFTPATAFCRKIRSWLRHVKMRESLLSVLHHRSFAILATRLLPATL